MAKREVLQNCITEGINSQDGVGKGDGREPPGKQHSHRSNCKLK